MEPSTAKSTVHNFISAARSAQEKRLSDFLAYESFALDGLQWTKAEKPAGNAPQLTFNQTADYITIYLSKLIPRNPLTGNMEVGVRVVETDPRLKEKYEREILDTYEKSFLPEILLEQAQNFLVGGSGCLYYPFDESAQSTRIISLDPKYCFTAWVGSHLTQFAFEDEVTVADIPVGEKTLIAAVKEYLTKVLRLSDPNAPIKRYTYWDKDQQIILIGDYVEVRANVRGFIPFSWIPNMPKSHRHEGRSDVKSLMHIDKEYNFRASDVGQRVKENTRPNLAVFTEADTDLISRDDKGILGLGKDDDAKFLTVPEEKTALDYLSILERRMQFKMGVNDAVLGAMRSNISASAMTYYFSPLLDRVSLKRVFWDRAFREMNRAILSYKFGLKNYSAQPVYHSPLTIDTAATTDNVVKLLQNHLISYVDAIDTVRGAENANTKFDAIKKEQADLATIPAFFGTPKNTSTV